jgi:hypothetical protein
MTANPDVHDAIATFGAFLESRWPALRTEQRARVVSLLVACVDEVAPRPTAANVVPIRGGRR